MSATAASAEPARPGPASVGPPAPAPPVALYLHVPFCLSICPYCDFAVVAGRAARGPSGQTEAFADALAVELRLRADGLDARWGPPSSRPALRSVYVGGGTPSLLPADAVASLLGLVRERYGLAPDAEVTIEVNPGPAERGNLAGFRLAGVNRVSIGAQSLRPAELRRLGRRHGPEDVRETVALVRAAGFASVSLDLLYDLPDQAEDDWLASLEGAIALEPDHLSLYALTLDDPDAEGLTGPIGDHLPLRPGARRWRERARRGQDEDRAAAMYEAADARLAGAGFAWYEISNWARPGHESRHNLAYWTHASYEAAGPGAHAFDGATRRWNAARLDGYLLALRPAAGRSNLPPGGGEPIDAARGAAERVILGLRTAAGVRIDASSALPFAGALAWAVDAGLAEIQTPHVRLTSRGRLLANEVFARLVA